MANSLKSALFLIESYMKDAESGDIDAYFELGVAYSSGMHGVDVDLIQAHKWFNLACLSGDERAQDARSDIAAELSARDIADAQRQARAWLNQTALRRAA